MEKGDYLTDVDNYCSVSKVLLTTKLLTEESIAQEIMSTDASKSSVEQSDAKSDSDNEPPDDVPSCQPPSSINSAVMKVLESKIFIAKALTTKQMIFFCILRVL